MKKKKKKKKMSKQPLYYEVLKLWVIKQNKFKNVEKSTC